MAILLLPTVMVLKIVIVAGFTVIVDIVLAWHYRRLIFVYCAVHLAIVNEHSSSDIRQVINGKIEMCVDV